MIYSFIILCLARQSDDPLNREDPHMVEQQDLFNRTHHLISPKQHRCISFQHVLRQVHDRQFQLSQRRRNIAGETVAGECQHREMLRKEPKDPGMVPEMRLPSREIPRRLGREEREGGSVPEIGRRNWVSGQRRWCG